MSDAKTLHDTELLLIEKHTPKPQLTNVSTVEQRGPSLIFEIRVAFSVSEIAFLAGVSVRTIDRTIQRGELNTKMVGRRRLVLKSELEAWLNRKD